MMIPWTALERERYSRQFVLKGFSASGQARLKQSRVLVVGAGGLGSPVLSYLAAAGIGTIGIVDHDHVTLSNLQRQVIFSEADIGKNKAAIAAEKLQVQNSSINLLPFPTKLSNENALDLVAGFDLVLDCTDNFPARYLLNDACVLTDKPFIYGSVQEFEGQVAVFNYRSAPGNFSSNYRDVFPQPPQPGEIKNCAEIGVLGALPGLIGSIQALEALKVIAGVGEPLVNQLLIVDALSMRQMIVKTPNKGARASIVGLVNYEDFCGISEDKGKSLEANQQHMKEVTVQELEKLKESGADFQLIDVREPYEYDICNIEGELIPMSEVPHAVDRIARDKQVILHCRSGKRSGDMLLWLEKNHNFDNLYNLRGGILAWAREIDPSMPTY